MVREGGVQGGGGRRHERQGVRGDAGAGPPARNGPLGGTAAAGAVVDVADEFAAQRRAEHHPLVAGEVRHAGAGAGLHDGEGRAGAFHLAGRGGEQLARRGRRHAEHGGDLVGGETVPHGELERLALLRAGPCGLRPGQRGQFTAAPLLLLGRQGGGGAPAEARCLPERPPACVA